MQGIFSACLLAVQMKTMKRIKKMKKRRKQWINLTRAASPQ